MLALSTRNHRFTLFKVGSLLVLIDLKKLFFNLSISCQLPISVKSQVLLPQVVAKNIFFSFKLDTSNNFSATLLLPCEELVT